MKLKLNLKHKDEGKVNVGCAIYQSDKKAFDIVCNEMGLSTSLIFRSLINDVIEGKIKIEV